MSRGKYIVLEGPEGVGKTTQIIELTRRLQAAGLPVRTLREPDSQSDLTARAIRQLTQDPRYPMNTNTEVLLYNAARSQSLQVIRQSVEQGVICVVDRNYLTTLAIQYYGRGDVPDYETINRIIGFAVNGVEPDLCIVLDAPVPMLKQRLSRRVQGERFDSLDDAFLERVRSGYLWEAQQRNLPVVFASEDADTVANNIWNLVAATLAIRKPSKSDGELESVGEIINKRKVTPSAVEPPLQLSHPADEQDSSSTSNDSLFVAPPSLNKTTSDIYQKQLKALVEAHERLKHKLGSSSEADNIARLTLPVAVYAAKDGRDLDLNLQNAKKHALASLVQKNLRETHDGAGESQTELIDYWPRSELALVPNILYSYSNLPHGELAKQVDSWSYEQKSTVLTTYLEDGALAAMGDAGYTVGIMGTYADVADLRKVNFNVVHQRLTPRYGYNSPDSLEEYKLVDDYEEIFDASFQLYSSLQEAGYEAEAQYATLLGHRLRMKITLSAAELLKARKKGEVPSNLLSKLADAIAEVHPLIGAALSKQPESAK